MELPSRQKCLKIIRKTGMPEHIVHHSEMVSNVAGFLAGKLQRTNPDINICLTAAAALLHDITKYESISTGELHSETGRVLIESLGFPEVADIVRQHVILDQYTESGPVTEVEIVNYSDKRTLHDQIVSLDIRLAYIWKRYGTNDNFSGRINYLWKKTKILEKKIFACLDFTPGELEKLVMKSIRA